VLRNREARSWIRRPLLARSGRPTVPGSQGSTAAVQGDVPVSSSTLSMFDIHGVALSVATQDQQIRAAVQRRLQHFESSGDHSPQLRFEVAQVREHDLPAPAASARSVYESPLGDVLYSEDSDQLFMNAGTDVRVLLDGATGWVRASVRGVLKPHVWLLTHPLFTVPLIELMKRRGRFSLHAAGVAVDGCGLLLAGTSGSGKSTLSLALLRAGFDFLGDDMLFVETAPDGVQVLAFPDEIDLTESTARFFPELAWIPDAPRAAGWPKWSFSAAQLYPTKSVMTCRARVLVFPRVASSERSTLEPLPAQDALIELAPNVLLTERRSAAAHFAVLAELVRSCACYRLNTGRDFDDVARMLRRLLP
jgi:hypothetical protein